MTIRQRIGNAIKRTGSWRPFRKESAIGKAVALFKLGQPVWTPRQYDKLAEEGYQKNVIAYSSINMVARGAASIEWTLNRKRADKLIEIKEHPLLTLLNRPNPLQGGSAFLESMYGYYLIAGNNYIESITNTRGTPLELYTHRPDRIKIVPGTFGLPQAYEYTINGVSQRVWEVDQIRGKSPLLHNKMFHPLNDWYGMSPLEAAAFWIDIHNQAGAWNKSLLDNGARPSGALIVKEELGNLTVEQKTELKKELREAYAGATNVGRPMLLEGGMDWKELGLSPKDMEYIESKNTSARDIALTYGVPPMLLGIKGDSTFNNQREARLSLWENTILPLAYLHRDEFNNWLVPMFDPSLVLGLNEDKILALAPRRDAIWDRVKGAEHLTLNEKRAATGQDEKPGGDELYVSMTQVPLGLGDVKKKNT
jgi:HK97 family phage portal protein